ncbi:DUF4255 domain-containing protein [Streptomyces netropsis]
MFDLVDTALKNLVTEIIKKTFPPPKNVIDVDFKAPAKGTDQTGNMRVGLYLYDVREDLTRRASGTMRSTHPRTDKTIEHDPPRYARLSYMATTWASDPGDEHRMLAALQTETSKATTLPVVFPPEMAALDLQVRLTVGTPTTEDRVLTELWSALETPCAPSSTSP